MNVGHCSSGIYDCDFSEIKDADSCAEYNGKYMDMEGHVWVVIVGAFVMCLMAFAVGANANSWGTSVGSGAIPLKYALATAGFFEMFGAVTLGYGVSSKLQEDVGDINDPNCWACGYCDSKISVFAVGMFAALLSTALCLLVATYTMLPVSTTHAIVGSIIGMTIAAVGSGCINWGYSGVGGIFASWLFSPLLAGVVAILLYSVIDRFVFKVKDSRSTILAALPGIFSLVCFCMVLIILVKSPLTHSLEYYVIVPVAIFSALVLYVFTWLVAVPRIMERLPSRNLDKRIDSNEDGSVELRTSENSLHTASRLNHGEISSHSKEDNEDTPDDVTVGSIESVGLEKSSREKLVASSVPGETTVEIKNSTLLDQPTVNNADMELLWNKADALYCFRYLLLFNAALLSYAHGANDTANSTAPFSAVLLIYHQGLDSCNDIGSQPVWVLFLAGGFVAIGVYMYGENVIRTVGENLVQMDFNKGFCIQFSTCISVLVASYVGFPVSTTHCQVGAVIALGCFSDGYKSVKWRIVYPILGAWALTVPLAGLLASAMSELIVLGLK